MPKCMVKSCPNVSGRHIASTGKILHGFPRKSTKITQWLEAAGTDPSALQELSGQILEDKRSNRFRICSDHFTPESYTLKKNKKCLIGSAVPSVFPSAGNNLLVPQIRRKKKGHSVSTDPMPVPTTSSATVQSSDAEVSSDMTCTVSCSCVCHGLSATVTRCTTEASTQTSDEDFISFLSLPPSDTCEVMGSFFPEHDYSCISVDRTGINLQSTPSKVVTAQDFFISDVLPFSSIANEEEDSAAITLIEEQDFATTSQSFFRSPQSSVTATPVKPTRKRKYEMDDSFHPDASQTSDDFSCRSTPVKRPVMQSNRVVDKHESLIKERKFIVFESCIDFLFLNQPCNNSECKKCVTELDKFIRGTMLTVYGTCSAKHKYKLWDSQPIVNNVGAGNLILASSIVSSGSSYSKVKEMFNYSAIAIFGDTTFQRYQQRYVFPAIHEQWLLEKAALRKGITGRSLYLAGDGQCDSPGHSAKYCCYTFVDLWTNKILDFEVVQVTETTSSVAMEKLGFKRCLNRIISEGGDVLMVGTDRHVGIRKLMRVEYPKIEHQFDIWHYAKSLKRKLHMSAKKSSCRELAPWIRQIITHFYWCSRKSKGDDDTFRNLWHGVLHHVVNEHEWMEENVTMKCHHVQRPPRNETLWLKRDNAPVLALSEIIMDRKMDKDIPHLTDFCQTGVIETFHSMVLKYRTKRIHYGMDSMEARTKLAILAHNGNTERPQAIVQCAREDTEPVGTLRTKTEFSKATRNWVSRKVMVPMNFDHIDDVLVTTLKLAGHQIVSRWKSRRPDLPQRVTSVAKPAKNLLVAHKRSRFHPVAAEQTSDE